MIKIRLKRLGRKKSPVYRIVILTSQQKREGKTIAEIGLYNPKTKELVLDKNLANEWIKKGAQPTETVKYLLDNSDENGKLVKAEKAAEKTSISRKAKAKLEAEKKAAESANA